MAYRRQASHQRSSQQQPDLRALFAMVDTDRSGEIDAKELQRALSNGTDIPFNLNTCHLLIGMVDANNNGHIDFNEFQNLWQTLNGWVRIFRQLDTDGSNTVSRLELSNAMSQAGYRFSDAMISAFMQHFDRSNTGQLLFDDFVQLNIIVFTLQINFRARDTSGHGVVVLSNEEFMNVVRWMSSLDFSFGLGIFVRRRNLAKSDSQLSRFIQPLNDKL